MAKRDKKAAAPAEDAMDAPPPVASELPLFFKSPHLVDRTRHAKASILPTPDYRFARGVNSIPLNAIEFIEAAKCYPIVFSLGEAPVPVAILGLEQENVFVDANGLWASNQYVPAYARQYPFIFMEQSGDERFYLCVDESAAQFSATPAPQGQPLYDAEGKPSELANHALQFCTQYYQHRQVTQQFCNDLLKHQLLGPYQTAYTTATGRTVQLNGFAMIDEAAFNGLSEAVFAEFRAKGWLPFIYLSLAATSNWKRVADRIPGEMQ